MEHKIFFIRNHLHSERREITEYPLRKKHYQIKKMTFFISLFIF